MRVATRRSGWSTTKGSARIPAGKDLKGAPAFLLKGWPFNGIVT